MKKLKAHKLGFLVFALFAISVQAQEDGTLERDSFVIIKEYVPTLSQAAKIRMNPEISDTHRLDLNLNYTFLDKEIESDYKPELIKAAALKGEPLVKLYRNYVILGGGNYYTPRAEVYLGQLRSKTLSYSVYARHLSSGDLRNVENSGFSQNRVGVNAQGYGRKFTYGGRLDYFYDHNNYYGWHKFDTNLIVSDAQRNENVMQFYNRLNGAVHFGNNQRDTVGLRHYSEIEFKLINDRYGASENRVIIGEELSLLNKTNIYTFNWALDYNKYALEEDIRVSDYASENAVLFLDPGIILKGPKWKLEAEVRLATEFLDETEVNVYPHAEFKYELIKTIIIPYAGITGGLTRNTYGDFVADNPFMSPVIPLANTSEQVRLYGGVGGHLSKNTSFDISVAQSDFKQMALYVKDTNSAEMRGFTVLYEDLTRTQATVELIYEPLVRWKLALRGDYFIYDTKNEEHAWHKPDYHVSFLAGYNLSEKIIVEMMAYVISQQKAKVFSPQKFETLDGTLDLNLSFEYRYNRKISVFLDLNNLANFEYEKWQDYPTQQFNLLGGFKFSF